MLKTFALAAIVSSAFIFNTVSAQPVPAVGKKFLSGHVAPAWQTLTPSGTLEKTNTLRLAISLPLQNLDALHQLLGELYDPASPNYHRFLTPAEFTARFGPTPEQYQAVENFATASGMKIVGRADNRTVLDVEAPASVVEQAFQVTLNEYQHPTKNRRFYAPSTEPSVAAALAILHVSGLNNYAMRVPHYTKRAASVVPHANNGSGPSGNYMGADFRNAYAPGTPLTGAGQSVGLLQFDGYAASDISYYYTKAGITPIALTNILIGGATGAPSGNGGEVEVCLDIQMVASMAPGLNSIVLFIAPNSNVDYWPDLINAMAARPDIKQFSCSWGNDTPGAEPGAEQGLLQLKAQGQTFFNATGDSDAFSTANPITFPSDSTNVVEVGATTLSMNGTGASYASETVWQWGLTSGSYVGSSGGVSTNFGIPPWQLGISMTANQGSTAKRNVPDVAACGDNVYVRADGADQTGTGGTSCAAPLWAGFTALVNQQAASNGLASVGFLNPALYDIGKSASFTNCFHDITTGNNTNSSSRTKYFAVAGYDLCTGWGTPRGTNLINALAPPSGPASILAAPSSQTNVYGGTATFSVTAGGTAPLAYQWYFTNAIPGATNSALTLNNLSTTNAGNYFVIVTNAFGRATSAVATLTVITAPVLTQSPSSQTNGYGSTVTFAANAIGAAPLGYQWFFTNAIAGATNSSLILSNLTAINAGNYFVVATNSFGSVTSAVAALTVVLSPVITQAPLSQTILAGQSAGFSVTAFGAPPLAYQWFFTNAIVDATNATLALADVSSTNAGNYFVVVTNDYGSATSSIAVLTVANPAAYSGVLAGWDMNALPGGSGNFGASPFAPTTNAPNVSVIGLVRGAGVTTSGFAAARGWGGSGFTSTSQSAAISANQYVTCDITAASGYSISVSAVSQFVYRRSSSGATTGTLQYQIGSGAFNDLTNLSYASSATGGAALPAIDLSGISALQNVPAGTTITFRLVNYNASSSGGTWYLYDQTTPGVNDFEITGSLAPTGSPAPTPPVATTGNATAITTNSATLNAIVNPNNLSTVAQFRYGLTTNYNLIAAVAGTLTGSTAQNVNATISGLLPATTYHFAITATNSSGSAIGLDQAFTTAAINSGGTGGTNFSGILVGWDVSGLSSYGVSPQAPTTNAPNVSVVGLTRGSGLAVGGSAAARAWGGNGWSLTTAAAGINGNQFMTFALTATNGGTMTISNVSRFDARRSNSGATNGVLQVQVGAGVFTDITNFTFSVSGSSVGPVDLSSISALQNIPPGTTVTFRMVGYNAGGSGGNWYVYDVANTTALDLSLSGSIVYTPSSSLPSISAQPVSTNVYAGMNAAVSASATGTAPLFYQWRKDGVSLADGNGITGSATNTLNFVPTITNHTGAYTLVVTNSAGAITSSIAQVSVLPLPILNAGQTAGVATVQFTALSNHLFKILRSTNLTTWSTVWSTNPPTGGTLQFSEPATNFPGMFYRLNISP